MGKHEKFPDQQIYIRTHDEIPPEEREETLVLDPEDPDHDPKTINLFVHTFSRMRAGFEVLSGGPLDGEYLRVSLFDDHNGTEVRLHFDPQTHQLWRNMVETAVLAKEITSLPEVEGEIGG